MVTTISYYWSPKSGTVALPTNPDTAYTVVETPVNVTSNVSGNLIPKTEFDELLEKTTALVLPSLSKCVKLPL